MRRYMSPAIYAILFMKYCTDIVPCGIVAASGRSSFDHYRHRDSVSRVQEVEKDVKDRTKGEMGACKTLCTPFEQPGLSEDTVSFMTALI
ncbi:hypothetical protein FEM48_Zijuj02G0139600 [Ziziphus jujuba var. spinosa]|uniref:Uncharacterized protein n=1 Tax=Ziziphus jujuba var. spinosa TaxID=714518 RepID=A0A978VW37_ZIZJJ|nr:hypothetical protein FEM48_Zijuj02G0139600 [Ziziphus jujuba var. spinosa]